MGFHAASRKCSSVPPRTLHSSHQLSRVAAEWASHLLVKSLRTDIVEGSLEAKLPTKWTDVKAQPGRSRARKKLGRGESQKGEDKRGRRPEREKVRREKMQVREKVGKSRATLCFSNVLCSGGSKSRLAKAAGAEPAGQMKYEQLHALVARSTF